MQGKGGLCWEVLLYTTHLRDLPCDGQEHRCPLHEVIKTGKAAVVEHIHYDKDGKEQHVEVSGFPVFDEKGKIVQMIEYVTDITERKRREKKLHELSIKDELTEIYNRRGFMELAGKQLHIAKRSKENLFLLYEDEASIVQRLKGSIGEENAKTGRRYELQVSVGTLRCDHDRACSLDELLSAADNLMYEEKVRKKERTTH